MTDADLVDKKLAFMEDRVAELRQLARPDQIPHDVREERFVAHSLQIAIQAALDVASHILSNDRLGEPETNYQFFDLLHRHGWLNEEQAQTMRSIVGLRNILVHGYQSVDLTILRDVVEHRLDDLLDFVKAIRSHLPRS